MGRWVVVVAVLCVPFLGGCAHEGLADSKTEIGHQDEVIRSLATKNEGLLAENGLLRTRAEAAEAEARRLREAADAARKAMEGMGDLDARLKALDAKLGKMDGVTSENDPRGPKIRLADTLLFKSGSDELSDGGKAALRKVAEVLNACSDKIVVEGHTDDQKVTASKNKFPLGNIELSGRRALKVTHFLTTECGVTAERVSYTGYGEFLPAKPNDSADNRAANRRVDIVILEHPVQR